jgi:hypothetical protein
LAADYLPLQRGVILAGVPPGVIYNFRALEYTTSRRFYRQAS